MLLLLGLLLMLACVALAVDAIAENGSSVHATAFQHSFTGLSVGELFLAGAVLGLLFALGMAMFTGGIGRAARRRRETRAMRRDSAEAESLREENARLESRLSADDSTAYPGEPAETTTSTTGRHRLRG